MFCCCYCILSFVRNVFLDNWHYWLFHVPLAVTFNTVSMSVVGVVIVVVVVVVVDDDAVIALLSASTELSDFPLHEFIE